MLARNRRQLEAQRGSDGIREARVGIGRYAARLIRHKAKQLIGKAGLTESDREDIEQELTLDLLNRMSAFDPTKAQWHTFATRLVEHQVATILEHRQAYCRDRRKESGSLDEEVKDAEGRETRRSQTVEADINRAGRSRKELLELKLDVESASSGLPDDLKRLCTLLRTKSVSEVSKEQGIPRPTLYESIKKLRVRFEDSGLRDYLENPD